MEHFPATELTIPSRFRGPEHSGNGGWSAGALAALVENDCPENRAETWPPIEVTLLQPPPLDVRSEEHTSELQSLMRISYAVFCLKKKTKENNNLYSASLIQL